jgi:ribosomal protein L40E
MADDSKYCGHCGMSLNRTSERLVHLSMNFSWIWRRSWAGFASGFIGWIIVFSISRMVGSGISPSAVNLFSGMICGVFLGTVGGIVEESGYKAFIGGLLGTIGGALGGLLNIPVREFAQGNEFLMPVSIVLTWAVGGGFIGATSGLIEKSGKKIAAGALLGLIGGAVGGFLGSSFYGSVLLQFKPDSWFMSRLLEGLSGGLVGAVLWFFVGLIEKLYIFRRREDPKLNKKICDSCGTENTLRSWYCVSCGHVLQVAAPRQKIVITPYRGMERIINAFKFMSWLFGVTGVITTPAVFFIFLMQDVFLAFISAVFFILFTYLMVVGFRFAADLLSCLVKLSSSPKPEAPAR